MNTQNIDTQKIKIVAYNSKINLHEEEIIENVFRIRITDICRSIWFDDGIVTIQIDGTEKLTIQPFAKSEACMEVLISGVN